MIFKSVRHNFRKSQDNIVAALDVGTNKVSCAIARLGSEMTLQLIGTGFQVSRGLKAGTIVDMEQLYRSVVQAVNHAEDDAKETINDVYVSVSPRLCHSSSVRVQLDTSGHTIDDNDLKKMLLQAIASSKKGDLSVLHTIPVAYKVDENTGIRDPRGMFGEVVEAKVNVILGRKTPLRNLSACIERCHLNSHQFVSSIYASGLATLVQDERELGVTLLDIGAGSTSIGLFHNDALAQVDHVPIGGAHITSDIARCFSTPIREAERIKILHGSALVSPADGRSSVYVPQIGDEQSSKGRQISKAELTGVIRPRVEELFETLVTKLSQLAGHKFCGRRLVITGGGSLLPGVPELAGLIMGKQTRHAKPLHISGLKAEHRLPGFSTCIGLLHYAQMLLQDEINAMTKNANMNRPGAFFRMGQWVRENF